MSDKQHADWWPPLIGSSVRVMLDGADELGNISDEELASFHELCENAPSDALLASAFVMDDEMHSRLMAGDFREANAYSKINAVLQKVRKARGLRAMGDMRPPSRLDKIKWDEVADEVLASLKERADERGAIPQWAEEVWRKFCANMPRAELRQTCDMVNEELRNALLGRELSTAFLLSDLLRSATSISERRKKDVSLADQVRVVEEARQDLRVTKEGEE